MVIPLKMDFRGHFCACRLEKGFQMHGMIMENMNSETLTICTICELCK